MLAAEVVEIVGLSGGLLILGAWAFETFEAIKAHKSLLDLRFSVVSLIGAILLAIYSAEIGAGMFLWLNVIIGAIMLFEICYPLCVKKIDKK
ncbi:MAG: hypothetical protein QW548_01390 [Candidatus Aenigmatarchaeota archaeon]